MTVPKITILITVTAVLISTVISADTPGSVGFIVFDGNNGLPITGSRVPDTGLPGIPFGNNPLQIINTGINSVVGLVPGAGGAGGIGLPGLGGGTGSPGLGGGTGIPGLGGIQIPFIGGAGGSQIPGVVILQGFLNSIGNTLSGVGGAGAPSIGKLEDFGSFPSGVGSYGNPNAGGSRTPSVVDIVYLK